MKHCKKIISSILTLTLFASSVVSLNCFATGNSDKPNTEQSQEEISNTFNRCRNYADELDEIKNSVNEKSWATSFDKAFERLNSLKSKLSENDKIVLAEHINATKSYLKEMKDKAFKYTDSLYDKKCKEITALNTKIEETCKKNEELSIDKFILGCAVGIGIAVIHLGLGAIYI